MDLVMRPAAVNRKLKTRTGRTRVRDCESESTYSKQRAYLGSESPRNVLLRSSFSGPYEELVQLHSQCRFNESKIQTFLSSN